MSCGTSSKDFSNENKIEIIEAPVNDYQAIGLVERLLQTIKIRIGFIKEKKSATGSFIIKHALKIIFHQLRKCKRKTTKISPFKAHFGRKPNRSLSLICNKPKLSNLSEKNFINTFLFEDTVTPEAILPNDKWQNV